MTKEELVKELDGIEYEELANEIEDASERAKAAGLVVAWGALDNLLEFTGAIREEVYACFGTATLLNSSGLVINRCDDAQCPYFGDIEYTFTIEAVWQDSSPNWTLKTDIPHATFDIMCDGEVFSRGIVFDFAALDV